MTSTSDSRPSYSVVAGFLYKGRYFDQLDYCNTYQKPPLERQYNLLNNLTEIGLVPQPRRGRRKSGGIWYFCQPKINLCNLV